MIPPETETFMADGSRTANRLPSRPHASLASQGEAIVSLIEEAAVPPHVRAQHTGRTGNDEVRWLPLA